MTGLCLTPAQKKIIVSQEFKRCKYLLLEGGSRSTKTTLIIACMLLIAEKYPFSRQLIVRQHLREVKASIMLDTIPKVSRLIGKGFGKMVSKALNKSDYVYTFPNGSEICLGGIGSEEQIDKILGTEYCLIFFNEISQIGFSPVEVILSRLAQNIEGFRNRVFMDLNPTFKKHWGYQLFHNKINPVDGLDRPNSKLYGYKVLNPHDNPHLPEGYIEEVLSGLSERQKKRFLLGEWLEEVEGALWSLDLIENNRVQQPPNSLERIVIGVDPAVTSNKKSDETGIIVGGYDGHYGYVLDDLSGRFSPHTWAKKIRDGFFEYNAHAIIVEDNQGGDLIIENIDLVFPNAPIIKVHAKTGKALRAEPIVSLYEKGLIKHVGHFPELEDQMVSHIFKDNKASSPDRIDALVYTFWDLMIETVRGFTKVY